MDNVRKNAPKPSTLPIRAVQVREAYETPENIHPKKTKEMRRFDSYDPEVYLTPQHLVDKITLDLSTDGEETPTEPEDENMRKNVFGHLVPKRKEEHIYVQDPEDEDGYTLATTRVIDAPQTTALPIPVHSDKPNRSNGSTPFKRLKKHRNIIIAFLIGLLVSGVVGVVVCSLREDVNNQPGIV